MYGYVSGNPVSNSDPTGMLTGADVMSAVKAAAATDAAGGGPEDPAGDVAAVIAAIAVLVEAAAQEKQAEYIKYKARCNQPPPPGLDPCENAKWRLQRNIDCYNMRKAWDAKWGPGNGHAAALVNAQQSIDNAQADVDKHCNKKCDEK